jgi:chromosome segregation ATPase
LIQCSSLEDKNSTLYGELAHIKTEFYSIQTELNSNRNTKQYTNDQLNSLQSEMKEKQDTISNILEQSKVTSATLNQQLFEAR